MEEGWYCRSMANQDGISDQQLRNVEHSSVRDDTSVSDGESHEQSRMGLQRGNSNTATGDTISGSERTSMVDYRAQYLCLKQKLKFLIYENEYFQDVLRFNQRRLLKVSRDRSFLLDRLLQYEKPDYSSSEDEATDSSDEETTAPASTAGLIKDNNKKRKLDSRHGATTSVGGATRGRKRKMAQTQGSVHQPKTVPLKSLQLRQMQKPKQITTQTNQAQPVRLNFSTQLQQTPQIVTELHTLTTSEPKNEIQLTTAEITRQLQARKPTAMELMSPECTSATVPATMLSDESPSKCFPNDQLHFLDDSSPSHVAAEECVPMEYTS